MSDNEKAAEALIWENIRLGYMELVGVGEDGQMRYRLTEAGQERVEQVQRGTVDQ